MHLYRSLSSQSSERTPTISSPMSSISNDLEVHRDCRARLDITFPAWYVILTHSDCIYLTCTSRWVPCPLSKQWTIPRSRKSPKRSSNTMWRRQSRTSRHHQCERDLLHPLIHPIRKRSRGHLKRPQPPLQSATRLQDHCKFPHPRLL